MPSISPLSVPSALSPLSLTRQCGFARSAPGATSSARRAVDAPGPAACTRRDPLCSLGWPVRRPGGADPVALVGPLGCQRHQHFLRRPVRLMSSYLGRRSRSLRRPVRLLPRPHGPPRGQAVPIGALPPPPGPPPRTPFGSGATWREHYPAGTFHSGVSGNARDATPLHPLQRQANAPCACTPTLPSTLMGLGSARVDGAARLLHPGAKRSSSAFAVAALHLPLPRWPRPSTSRPPTFEFPV